MIVFDDSLSAVDTETDEAIRENLSRSRSPGSRRFWSRTGF